MKLKIFIICLLTLAFIQCKSQSLVDLTKDEVKLVVKKELNKFSPDKRIVKQQFNYLKFINRSETITLIVYFSKNDTAISSKLICDYAEKDFMLNDLNEKYEKVGDKNWEYEKEGITYNVEMKDLEWYFTVKEKLKI